MPSPALIRDASSPGPAGAFARAVGSPGSGPAQILESVARRHDADLAALGVAFDFVASENELARSGAVERLVSELIAGGVGYERAGAVWLRTTAFGDDQDRVLLREDDVPTYYAGDLAYHQDKLARGAARMIDLWDTDHAAYVRRTHAGLAALGIAPETLTVALVGPVRVIDDGVERRIGRFGGAVTLEEVVEAIGADAVRGQLLKAPLAEPVTLQLVQDASSLAWGEPTTVLSAGAALSDAGAAALLLRFSSAVDDAIAALDPSRLWNYASEVERRIAAESVHQELRSLVLQRCAALLGRKNKT